jgi:hypothetical protein
MDIILNPKIQHIRRRKNKLLFESIQNGDRSYEICPNTPDFSLEAGDVITFQETEQDGELTGRAVTKKVLSSEPLTELKQVLQAEAEGQDLTQLDYSILGLVSVQYRSLRSIYEYAVTLHMAVDVKGSGEGWEVVEGPFYSPPLAAPDLMELGTTAGLHLERWPPGRYSIILMSRITELLVLTLIQAGETQRQYGRMLFEELDPVAILDGRTLNLNGVAITPLSPSEVDKFTALEVDNRQDQYESQYGEVTDSLLENADDGPR